ncbi:type II CAAX prenyl endopeptidase Rce1 family protein [Spirosoma sp. 209]|uniref:CPBP family glutamic-type intramembrane protease n=1 Tax=Spirosoma sp. 209 TaxID=1955701 RepID=UPI00351294F0
MIIICLILAPLIETLLCQYIPMILLIKLKFNTNIQILVSSTIFSVGHYYSISYMIFMFILGILWAWYTNYCRNNFNNCYWPVVFLHFNYNLIIIVVQNINHI